MNFRTLRRRVVVWWIRVFDVPYMADRAGRRSGRLAARALYGGWDNVPAYVRGYLKWRRR